MTMKASVAKGAMALGATRIVTNAASMIALVILARLLTPEDFGLVAIGTTVLGIVVALTELSLGSALIQRTEVTQEHVDSAWTMALIRAGLIIGGFAVAAWPLSVLYDDLRLIPVFIVSGATGAMTGLINPMIALRTKQMSFRPMLTMQITQKVAGLVISIGLALWLRNYWAIVAGTAIGTALSILMSYFVIPYRPRLTLSRSKDLLGFSSWLFFGQVANVLNWRFDQLIIGLFLPKAQLGAYSMADNLSAIPSRETTAPITQALFPSFSRMQDDVGRLRGAYLTAQATIALVALPLGVGLAVLAGPIVRVALGEKWMMAAPLVEVIACSYAVQTLTTGSRPLAMSRGKTKGLFVRDLIGLGLRVPFVLVGLAGWGLMGMVWGRALSSLVGVFISFALVRQILGLPITEQIWSHRRTVVSVGIMAAAVLLADQQLVAMGAEPIVRIIALVPAGGIAFLGSLGLLWAIGGFRPGAETELLGLARGVIAKV